MPRVHAFILATVLLGLSPASRAELTLEPCELTSSQGIVRLDARCGWYERPENPDAPDAATVRLKVAVIPALSPNPKADAFTVINGGPGGSSIDMYVDSAGIYSAIRRERDILIVDQRGTGASNPLACETLDDSAAMETGYDAELIRSATQQCLDTLPGDPRFYTTSVAVRDLEATREALGYPQLNVYGVSYGSRVAQHYARRYPGSIRTLIIDGVVPPEVPLGPNVALNAQAVLDRLFDRCAEDPDCSAAFPQLPTHFAALQSRLRDSSVDLELAHPVTGNAESLSLALAHLAVTVRLLSYAPETSTLIPLIIEEAQLKENYLPIATNALRILTSLSTSIQAGMHNSVVCTEDIPYIGEVDNEALDATYIGADQIRSLQEICTLWPIGPLDDDFHKPLDTDVPTLILSGEEDPITPPLYGEMAAQHLPNSLHIVGPGQGHGLVTRGCVPRLVSEFVESADLSILDTSCVERLGHRPFFLDLMGPAP